MRHRARRGDLGRADSTVEFHPWNSRRADTEKPDEWRIDLDPGPECDFATVQRVAHVAHEVLDELGAVGWPKTSGERAARDGDQRKYPWGNEEPGADKAVFAHQVEYAYEGGLEPVGSLPAGRSPDGVYDLEGNVSEWVGDWFTESFSVDDVRNAGRAQKVIRGSGWHEPMERIGGSRRYQASPDNRTDDVGIRCAMNAESG